MADNTSLNPQGAHPQGAHPQGAERAARQHRRPTRRAIKQR